MAIGIYGFTHNTAELQNRLEGAIVTGILYCIDQLVRQEMTDVRMTNQRAISGLHDKVEKYIYESAEGTVVLEALFQAPGSDDGNPAGYFNCSFCIYGSQLPPEKEAELTQRVQEYFQGLRLITQVTSHTQDLDTFSHFKPEYKARWSALLAGVGAAKSKPKRTRSIPELPIPGKIVNLAEY